MTNQKRRLFRTVLAGGVACLILFTPSVALGWGSAGHQIMARIADRRLNRNARTQVRMLLAVKMKLGGTYATSDLARASTWADEIRGVSNYPREFGQLHFIENQFPTSGEVPTPNIVTALRDNVKTLQTSTDLHAKAQALRFIIHFVGDIHQPLHCATRVDTVNPKGDQNGLLLTIQVADSSGRVRSTRLHAYWDSGLDTFEGSTTSIATMIERANPDPELKLQTDPFNFQGWADESFKLAKDVAYAGIPSDRKLDIDMNSKSPSKGFRVSTTYKTRALKVVNQQIALSGYRLAKLLNAIWPER